MTENPALLPPGSSRSIAGVLLKSTDALLFVGLLCLGALALVAVALFAPVALVFFAAAGAVGLNREVNRWRAAGPA